MTSVEQKCTLLIQRTVQACTHTSMHSCAQCTDTIALPPQSFDSGNIHKNPNKVNKVQSKLFKCKKLASAPKMSNITYTTKGNVQENVNTFKDLGVIFDNHFTFDKYISGPASQAGLLFVLHWTWTICRHSTSTICSSISSWAIPEQSRLWQALPKCRQAKLFLNTPDKGLARFALSPEKKDLRILVRLLTDHADLNLHLKIMGLRNEVVCPLCQDEEETSFHCSVQCHNATPKIYPRWLHALTGHS